MILTGDSRLLVQLADVDMFSSRLYGQDSQYVLDSDAITGWYDGPGIRRDTTPRLAVDGDFYEPAVKTSRLMTVTGTAIAPNSKVLQEMRDKLMGLVSNGTYMEMAVTTENIRRTATVGLEGKPQWVLLSDTVASFKIDLYAPDPRIYGEWQKVNISQGGNSGNLQFILVHPINFNRSANDIASTVTNKGNTNAYPQFKVTGDFTQGFTLTDNRAGKVTFSGIVTPQAPVIVDMAKATATQNGVDKSVLLTVRDWFWIAPGETITPTFIANKDGAGWCDIMIRDTWI